MFGKAGVEKRPSTPLRNELITSRKIPLTLRTDLIEDASVGSAPWEISNQMATVAIKRAAELRNMILRALNEQGISSH